MSPFRDLATLLSLSLPTLFLKRCQHVWFFSPTLPTPPPLLFLHVRVWDSRRRKKSGKERWTCCQRKVWMEKKNRVSCVPVSRQSVNGKVRCFDNSWVIMLIVFWSCKLFLHEDIFAKSEYSLYNFIFCPRKVSRWKLWTQFFFLLKFFLVLFSMGIYISRIRRGGGW